MSSNQSSAASGSNSTPSMTPSNQSGESRHTRGRTDVAWNHIMEVGKNKLKCLYCDKVISGGGIHRIKKHLAKVTGDVASCKKVPLNVQLEIKEDLESVSSQGRKKQVIPKRRTFPSLDDDDVQICQGPYSLNEKEDTAKKIKGFSGGTQPSIRSAMAGKHAIENAHIGIAKWFFDNCIPFNACNSPYWQSMFDAILPIGPGFKAPTYHDMRGFLLKKNVDELKSIVDRYKEKWSQLGCTIMADGWTDRKGRTLINFLVYCSKGTIFLKSVDASEYAKTGEMLAKLLCEVVEEVGDRNVIQVVTDNAANYKLAGHLLNMKFPHIVWTPCAAHCVDLMLEDIGKLEDVKMVIDKARSISCFIYNHSFVFIIDKKVY